MIRLLPLLLLSSCASVPSLTCDKADTVRAAAMLTLRTIDRLCPMSGVSPSENRLAIQADRFVLIGGKAPRSVRPGDPADRRDDIRQGLNGDTGSDERKQ